MRRLMFVVGGSLVGAIIYPLLSLIAILVVVGGYAVVGAFGPLDWPERLEAVSVTQLLVVTGYVGMFVGGLIGAVWDTK